jgi:hypothetical protein
MDSFFHKVPPNLPLMTLARVNGFEDNYQAFYFLQKLKKHAENRSAQATYMCEWIKFVEAKNLDELRERTPLKIREYSRPWFKGFASPAATHICIVMEDGEFGYFRVHK